MPAGSATKVVPQAILARAATVSPIIALLDADEHGRAASKKLTSFNDWSTKTSVLRLDSWPGSCGKHDIEIEDLVPLEVIDDLISDLGEIAFDEKVKCGQTWHYRLSIEGKEDLIKSMGVRLARLDPDITAIEWLVEEIRRRAGL